jgi:hypothetical protein
MKYTHLYVDSEGETHFEDVEVEFEESKIWSGSPQQGFSMRWPTSESFFVTNYTEFFTYYHPTPLKQWMVVLSGTGEFGASDGEVRGFGPGDVVLLDDTDSLGHTTRGFEPVSVMFVGLEE